MRASPALALALALAAGGSSRRGRRRGTLAASIAFALALVSPAVVADPAIPTAALAGEGTLLGVACVSEYRITLSGAEDGGRWVVYGALASTSFPQGCPSRSPAVAYSGAWDPRAGGCLSSASGERLCLMSPGNADPLFRYDASIVTAANVVALRGVVQAVVAS